MYSDATARCAQLQYQPSLFFYEVDSVTEMEATPCGTVEESPVREENKHHHQPPCMQNGKSLPIKAGPSKVIHHKETSSGQPSLDFSDDALFPSLGLTLNGTGNARYGLTNGARPRGGEKRRPA